MPAMTSRLTAGTEGSQEPSADPHARRRTWAECQRGPDLYATLVTVAQRPHNSPKTAHSLREAGWLWSHGGARRCHSRGGRGSPSRRRWLEDGWRPLPWSRRSCSCSPSRWSTWSSSRPAATGERCEIGINANYPTDCASPGLLDPLVKLRG